MTAYPGPGRYHIRRLMLQEDMAAVCAIENQVAKLKGRSEDSAWMPEDFFDSYVQENTFAYVMESAGKVVGHVFYEVHKDHMLMRRMTVKDDCDDLKLAFLNHLKEESSYLAHPHLIMLVGHREFKDIRFLVDNGFRVDRTLPDHFNDTGEDAYVMRYSEAALDTPIDFDRPSYVEACAMIGKCSEEDVIQRIMRFRSKLTACTGVEWGVFYPNARGALVQAFPENLKSVPRILYVTLAQFQNADRISQLLLSGSETQDKVTDIGITHGMAPDRGLYMENMHEMSPRERAFYFTPVDPDTGPQAMRDWESRVVWDPGPPHGRHRKFGRGA